MLGRGFKPRATVKVGEIPDLISKLGLSSEQIVNLTIEQTDSSLTAVLDRLDKNAQKKE